MRHENLNLFFITSLFGFVFLLICVSYVKNEKLWSYVITLNVEKLSEQWNDCFLDFDKTLTAISSERIALFSFQFWYRSKFSFSFKISSLTMLSSQHNNVMKIFFTGTSLRAEFIFTKSRHFLEFFQTIFFLILCKVIAIIFTSHPFVYVFLFIFSQLFSG